MTTEIEKQFFEAFGIEPKYEDACELADEYWNNEHLANEYGMFDNYMEAKGCPINKDGCTDNCRHSYTKEVYPQITDSHYLKMICLIAEKLNCFTNYDIDYKNLKEYILKEMILEKDYFNKQQVQALFEEG